MRGGNAAKPAGRQAPRGQAGSPEPATDAASRTASDFDEYSFLLNHGVAPQTLTRACTLARRWGTAPHEVLLANRWIGEAAYCKALAERCGTRFVPGRESLKLRPANPGDGPRECLRIGLLSQRRHGATGLVMAPGRARPNALKSLLEASPGGPGRIALTVTRAVRASILRRFGSHILLDAVQGLKARRPDESASDRMSRGQRLTFALLLSLTIVFGTIAPLETLRGLTAAATLFFFLVVLLRTVACVHLALALPARWLRRRQARIPDAALPVYTVFVPLYREAKVLPGLAQSLAALDYPAAKLDIKLILESVDKETIAAARALRLPGNFDVIVVPDGGPRTKPKALNYALQFARGEFAVIYDAEDRPDPNQLRKALAAFRTGPANLVCVQARLNFYNAKENWLTRQFAIEYGALFDGLLPALQMLGLPIPLGGTSNHFRMAALKWLGAWDAFNVTEDADLGMRLYRRGYVCHMLDSTTMEEATCRFGPWLRQRTRWIKGFMQTWQVHMRKPVRLWRELGTARFLGFQVIVGGMLFSALIYPWFYILVGIEAANGGLLQRPGSLLGTPLWLLALFNAALGFAASMTLALLALRWRGARLAPHILFMPFYWLMISLAAYRALYQLVREPFLWEKTEHGVSSMVDHLESEPNSALRHAESA